MTEPPVASGRFASDWHLLSTIDGRRWQIDETQDRCVLRSEHGFIRNTGSWFLQLNLESVATRHIHNLPPDPVVTKLTAARFMTRLQGAHFRFELNFRNRGRLLNSQGIVCAQMTPAPGHADPRTRAHLSEVQRAQDRGLLDPDFRARADFRLNNRSRLRQLAAAQDAGYVPDDEWQFVVIFAQWRAAGTGDWVYSPLHGGTSREVKAELDEAEIKLTANSANRGIRVSDLFSSR